MNESTKIAIVALIGVLIGSLIASVPSFDKSIVQQEILDSLCAGIGYARAFDWELTKKPRVKCGNEDGSFEWTTLYKL